MDGDVEREARTEVLRDCKQLEEAVRAEII